MLRRVTTCNCELITWYQGGAITQGYLKHVSCGSHHGPGIIDHHLSVWWASVQARLNQLLIFQTVLREGRGREKELLASIHNYPVYEQGEHAIATRHGPYLRPGLHSYV